MPDDDAFLKRLAQRASALQMLLAIVLILFLIQLWLVTAAFEDVMAARNRLLMPTFVASGVCFFINLGLLKYVYDLDEEE